MKRFLAVPLVMLAVLFLTGCTTASQGVDVQNLVPADANLIAQVQIQRILNDADFEKLYRQAPKGPAVPQDFDGLMDLAEQETGIDIRQFTQVVLFADVSQKEDYFGVIAIGSVNETKIIEAINAGGDAKLEPTDFRGVRVYRDQQDEDTPYIAFLDGETTIIGTQLAVHNVIAVQQGSMASISGQVYETFIGLGNPLVSLAVAVPPEAFDAIEESLGSAQGFGMLPAMVAIQDIEVVGILIDKLGSDIKIVSKVGFVDASSAAEMGNTLDGLLKLAAGFIPEEGTRQLIKKLQLNVNGRFITISLQVPLSELQEVTRDLAPDLGGTY
ncbi:MAG: hypothetical protein IIC33_02750 [Chloroflexi bacterium]|nr:hypothetical protein [Chloroflexota bacterium]